MTHTWDYPETILHKATKLFKDKDRALLAAVYVLFEKEWKSPREVGKELDILPTKAVELFDEAVFARAQHDDFKGKLDELLNG